MTQNHSGKNAYIEELNACTFLKALLLSRGERFYVWESGICGCLRMKSLLERLRFRKVLATELGDPGIKHDLNMRATDLAVRTVDTDPVISGFIDKMSRQYGFTKETRDKARTALAYNLAKGIYKPLLAETLLSRMKEKRRDSECITIVWDYPFLSEYSVPSTFFATHISIFLRVRTIIGKIADMLVCVLRSLKKRFVFSKETANYLKDWDGIAYFPGFNCFHKKGRKKRYYFETVIYDRDKNSVLHPSKILHLFEGAVSDRDTLEFLKRKGVTAIDFRKLVGGKGYFLESCLDQLCFLPSTMKIPLVEVSQIIEQVRNGIFLCRSLPGIKIFYMGYDRHFPRWLLVAFSACARPTVATMYAPPYHEISAGFTCYDFYGVWAEKFVKDDKEHFGCPREYFVPGPPRVDLVYGFEKIRGINERFRLLHGKYKIVLAIDFGGYIPEGTDIYTNGQVIEFYETLIALLEGNEDLFIISCLRSPASLKDYQSRPVFREMYEKIENNSRISLDAETDTYQLISWADLVIVGNLSTVGAEALAARKPTCYYDMRRIRERELESFGIVYRERRSLVSAVEKSLSGSDGMDWQRLYDMFGNRFFDGRSRARIRKKVRELYRRECSRSDG